MAIDAEGDTVKLDPRADRDGLAWVDVWAPNRLPVVKVVESKEQIPGKVVFRYSVHECRPDPRRAV